MSPEAKRPTADQVALLAELEYQAYHGHGLYHNNVLMGTTAAALRDAWGLPPYDPAQGPLYTYPAPATKEP